MLIVFVPPPGGLHRLTERAACALCHYFLLDKEVNVPRRGWALMEREEVTTAHCAFDVFVFGSSASLSHRLFVGRLNLA